MKENNQLKNELNTANLELEQLESRFAMQVDEYEIEIENITQKLKEKENTVKVSLIYSQNFDTYIYIYIPEDLPICYMALNFTRNQNGVFGPVLNTPKNLMSFFS